MIDNPPTITEDIEQDAQEVVYEVDPDGLWATHVLICTDCNSLSPTALAGAKREIAQDGLPVSETCHACETTQRHYEVRALRRRQQR